MGSGWVAFAGAYLMISGVVNMIWGVTALTKKAYFADGGLLWSGLSTWGWIAVVVAAIQILVGGLLFARKVLGIVFAIAPVEVAAAFLEPLPQAASSPGTLRNAPPARARRRT